MHLVQQLTTHREEKPEHDFRDRQVRLVPEPEPDPDAYQKPGPYCM